MVSPFTENLLRLPSGWVQLVIQELTNSRSLTKELQLLLEKPSAAFPSPLPQELLEKILLSIDHALFILNSCQSQNERQNPETTHDPSAYAGDRGIRNSGDQPKVRANRDRKAAGNKRRRISAQTSTRVSATPFDDGCMWRKYGQKNILGAKYPRAYFRCTYKNDQGCKAKKQVQKSESNPYSYVVTYVGHHSCKNVIRAPRLILESTSGDFSLLGFNSTTVAKDYHPNISSVQANNWESMLAMRSNIDANHNYYSSTSNYLRSFDDQVVFATDQTTTIADGGDVASSGHSRLSSHYLDTFEGCTSF